jgi:UDP-N-acetylglucosamine diphosphorylase/glucosamine-1-phosphate N-acetyltransferase
MSREDSIVIYEDHGFRRFGPLTLTRASFQLRCGIFALGERIEKLFQPVESAYLARQDLKGVVAEQGTEVFEPRTSVETFVNGRVLATPVLVEEVGSLETNQFLAAGDEVVAFKCDPAMADGLISAEADLTAFERIEVDARVFKYPWELVLSNAEVITADFLMLTAGDEVEGEIDSGAQVFGEEPLRLCRDARIMAGALIDVTDGPVYVGKNAIIMPGAYVQGPAYIGPDSVIKAGAKIYSGTSIGPVCKIGGEVGETIVQGFSNKQHDGFIGHSYLGEWVNIGAGTDNSDLKNNYSNVRVVIDGEEIDTGETFVGMIAGDHFKCGIGSTFNTGTVAGVCSNIFGPGFAPKYVPSFSWGGAGGLVEYDVEKAIETARRVMRRRSKELTAAQEKLLRHIHQSTASERDRLHIV